MFSIPLSLFLLLYILVLVGYCIFFFLIVYHLFASSTFTVTTMFMTLFTITLLALTIGGTFYVLRDVNWQTRISIFGSHMNISPFDSF